MEAPKDNAIATTRQLLAALLSGFPRNDYKVRLWDGSLWPQTTNGGAESSFTLVLNEPGSLRSMFGAVSPLSMGEAFLNGAFDVEGNILVACELADYLMRLRLPLSTKVKLGLKLRALPTRPASSGGRARARLSGRIGSRRRMQAAIAYHYDLPVEFWKSWLDPTLAYSCAYFKSPTDSLNQAQLNKLDYVCRKLYLKKGERLLDLGCGWGGLVMFAVQNYGVTAKGITLSRTQAEYGNQRLRQLGLQEKCEIEHRDFRHYESKEPYDKIASIGAVEHIPVAELPAFFRHAKSLLKPAGLFLNHGITAAGLDGHPEGKSFVNEYVFPDNGVTNVSRLLTAAEEVGFEIRDVECLREHYMRTCEKWLQRIEENGAEMAKHSNPSTQRLFRLYVAAQTFYFATGASSIHQMLLANSDSKPLEIPLTRKSWYDANGNEVV